MQELSEVLERVVARLESLHVREPTSGDVDEARVLVEELRPLSGSQRAFWIRNSEILQTIPVAERLLDVASREANEDADAALGWLEALDAVLDSPLLDSPDPVAAAAAELTLRQQAARAIALARLGRYDDAELVLATARKMGAFDPLTVGELLEAEGLVAACRQNIDRATRAFGRARVLYLSIRDRHLAARAMLRSSWAHAEAGEYARAVELGAEACDGLDPLRDRRLSLVALFNLARFLKDDGRLEAALAVVARARPLFDEHRGRVDRLHLEWFEAGVLAEVGRHAAAAATYERAAEGFAERGLVLEVGNIGVEAAEVFDRAGRHELATNLLALAVKAMRAAGRERDELAALLALQEAVERRAVTAALLDRATRSLERAVR